VIDWFVYWFMFPACILIASVAMLTGISGTAMLTPFLILVFPILSVHILTPGQAVGMALFTEFFGFASGVVGYQRAHLIDYKTGWKLVRVAVPIMIVFSLLSQLVSSDVLRVAYGVMMLGLSAYLFLTATGNVRNRNLEVLPEAAERIPRKREAALERVVTAQDGKEYRYKICDQRRGYLITCAGAAMEGLVSVGLGELEMPNLVKRCKIPVAVSAATSVFVIAVAVLSGSITSVAVLIQKGGLGAVPWNLVLYTIPGAVLGGQLGSRFQGRISSAYSERLIAILFVVVGIAFLYTSAPRLLG
jgi:uncharacterized membrane protein YfcA